MAGPAAAGPLVPQCLTLIELRPVVCGSPSVQAASLGNWTSHQSCSQSLECSIMSLTCPSSALFIILSFCTVSEAWVWNHRAGEHAQESGEVAPVEPRRRWNHAAVFARRQSEELVCSDDWFSDFLNANPSPRIKTFCNHWLGIQPATVVEEVTPTMCALLRTLLVCATYTSQHSHDQRGFNYN
jgi:hypothetical protein